MKYHVEFDIEFKRNPYKSLYIAFEGIDGSGKTTQVKRLQEYFKKKDHRVVITSEPRIDLFGGEDIMKVLTSQVIIPPTAFQYLLTANRVINHDQHVEPKLREEKHVISDRCFWSALAYGLTDKSRDSYGINEASLMLCAHGLLSHYHQFLTPDIVFYIDISPETAMERIHKRKNRENDLYEKKEKLERVVKAYRWLAKTFPQELTVIDGEQSIDEVNATILQILEKKISDKR